ncbi:MAG: hypothetical protein OSA38_00930 [Candidatus Poseidoniaceae archaeon]|nr:hypothetical protein [Candidatus Poseidoniaceae archaeon]
MPELEVLERGTWEACLSAPIAVLMLGKNNCAACATWTEDLTAYLEGDDAPENVKFGKLLLDTPGLGRFKIAQPWVAEVDVLPYNAIFVNGERVKEWAGGNIDRLVNRLNRYL